MIEVWGRPAFFRQRPGPGDRTLLFLHGAGSSLTTWRLQLAGPGWREGLLAVDLPGHRYSATLGVPVSISSYADWLFAFLEALAAEEGEPRRWVLVGHSMGGAVAQEFALRHPERLAGLVLAGTGARLRVARALLDALQRGEFPQPGMGFSPQTSLSLVNEQALEQEKVPVRVHFEDMLACDRFDRMKEAKGIRVPTLVVTGEEDRLTPPRYGEYLAAQIPDATLTLIPAAGHMLMLEQPQSFRQALESFAERLG